MQKYPFRLKTRRMGNPSQILSKPVSIRIQKPYQKVSVKTSYTTHKNVPQHSYREKQTEKQLKWKTIKQSFPYPRNSRLWSREMQASLHRDIQAVLAELLLTDKRWEQFKHPSTSRQVTVDPDNGIVLYLTKQELKSPEQKPCLF